MHNSKVVSQRPAFVAKNARLFVYLTSVQPRGSPERNMGADGARLPSGIGWWVLGWKRFAQFSGRSSRREYWTFVLVNFLLLACIAFSSPSIEQFRISGGICLLVLIIPSLAVGVRRLHDLNKSGGWMLLAFIPFLGGVALFVIMLLKGDSGANQYGDNPSTATLSVNSS